MKEPKPFITWLEPAKNAPPGIWGVCYAFNFWQQYRIT